MLPPPLQAALIDYIHACFKQAELQHDIEIPAEDKEFLIAVTPARLEAQIAKFVNGAVEHHDSPFTSMSPDDMIREAIKESTDLPNYLDGYFFVKAARAKAISRIQ